MNDHGQLPQRLELLGRKIGYTPSRVASVMNCVDQQPAYSTTHGKLFLAWVMKVRVALAGGVMIAGIGVLDLGGAHTVRLPVLGSTEKVYVTLALLIAAIILMVPYIGSRIRITSVSEMSRRVVLMSEIGVLIGLLLANVIPFALCSFR